MSEKKPSELDWRYENLRRICEAVSQTLGRHCEMVIHDFKDFKRSLVYVAGNVTGREGGAPVTDLVVKQWKAQGDTAEDLLCYRTETPDGRTLKSSTCFVRDRRGKIMGAVCINLDVSGFAAALRQLEELTRMDTGERSAGAETFAGNLAETLDAILERALTEVGKPPAAMTRAEKLAVVGILEREGAFLIKGVVSDVARALGVTKYTIYNYLNELRPRAKPR